jgi:membrane fusion protein (multidrug efflux system)
MVTPGIVHCLHHADFLHFHIMKKLDTSSVPSKFTASVYICLLLVGVFGCKEKPQAMAPPPMPVIAAPVVVRDQPVYYESLAQALGSQDVEIRARVEGILGDIHFREGSVVKAGDLLYTIDPRTLEANLDQAKGNLTQAESALDKAKRDVARLTPLWEKDAISRQMLDDAIAAERSAKGAVNTAKAAVENTDIQLGYTKIFAPIDGLIGKTEVKPGNLVGRGQNTLLTTISGADPIHFRFSISEQEYLVWRRMHAEDEQAREAAKNVFELVLSDGTVHPHKGSVVFADRNLDPTTGTLLLEVAFSNPGNVLRPGQFGRIRLPIRQISNALLVPQRAVSELQATYSVFVVTPDNRAEFRKVTPGPRVGSMYVIESGLQPGELVVIEGSQKLQNNMPVTVTRKAIETETSATAE